MKIEGFTGNGDGFKEYLDVTLDRADGRAVTLRLQALPIGFDSTIRKRIPIPSAPFGGAIIHKGQPVKDPETGRVAAWFNDQDSEYLRLTAISKQRQSTAMFVMAIQDDPNVTLETKCSCDNGSPASDWEAYYDAVLKELHAFGFSPGDLIAIEAAITRVSALDADSIEAARKGFFTRAERERFASASSEQQNDSE